MTPCFGSGSLSLVLDNELPLLQWIYFLRTVTMEGMLLKGGKYLFLLVAWNENRFLIFRLSCHFICNIIKHPPIMAKVAWCAVVHGAAKGWTQLTDWTELNNGQNRVTISLTLNITAHMETHFSLNAKHSRMDIWGPFWKSPDEENFGEHKEAFLIF